MVYWCLYNISFWIFLSFDDIDEKELFLCSLQAQSNRVEQNIWIYQMLLKAKLWCLWSQITTVPQGQIQGSGISASLFVWLNTFVLLLGDIWFGIHTPHSKQYIIAIWPESWLIISPRIVALLHQWLLQSSNNYHLLVFSPWSCTSLPVNILRTGQLVCFSNIE